MGLGGVNNVIVIFGFADLAMIKLFFGDRFFVPHILNEDVVFDEGRGTNRTYAKNTLNPYEPKMKRCTEYMRDIFISD